MFLRKLCCLDRTGNPVRNMRSGSAAAAVMAAGREETVLTGGIAVSAQEETADLRKPGNRLLKPDRSRLLKEQKQQNKIRSGSNSQLPDGASHRQRGRRLQPHHESIHAGLQPFLSSDLCFRKTESIHECCIPAVRSGYETARLAFRTWLFQIWSLQSFLRYVHSEGMITRHWTAVFFSYRGSTSLYMSGLTGMSNSPMYSRTSAPRLCLWFERPSSRDPSTPLISQ